ncbi:hypothetical protein [Acidicapsa acidisoli]|uniref:hypothetical protein n=1 Tax=Acidicapsa acidisoli TaxID=1615681 RepID=UPI0021E0B02A|nr:hypothetical protein [Acidicapsa acidisoli]
MFPVIGIERIYHPDEADEDGDAVIHSRIVELTAAVFAPAPHRRQPETGKMLAENSRPRRRFHGTVKCLSVP